MLQLESLSQEIIDRYEDEGALSQPWETMGELEELTDTLLARLRVDRRALATQRGGASAVRAVLDDRVRTETTELLDRPDVSDATKVRLVRVLHRVNQLAGTYRTFVSTLAPWIRGAARDRGRPARLLELASGAGEFTLALAAAARDQRLPLEVTGSDIVPAHVEQANALAGERRLDVRFRRLNAFDMSDLAPGDFDLVFIGQSLHHFTPGQVAMLIAQARRVASHAFIGVDGFRSLSTLAAVSTFCLPVAALARTPGFLHDAMVSARKFYAVAELDLIARLAAPVATVTVRRALPLHSVLTVS